MTNPTAPSERLLYPNLSTVNEQYINEKIQANNKFNNNINLIKVIVQYIIAILLQSKLLDNKGKDSLEMHYSFNQ